MVFKWKEQHYILTAAHVIPELLGENAAISVRPLDFKSEINIEVEGVFVTKSYILSGQQDIGMVCFKFTDRNYKKYNFTIQEIDIELNDPCLLDEDPSNRYFYYGESVDLILEGQRLAPDEQPKATDPERFRVKTSCESKHGCSGSPMFSHYGKLHSLVHGVNKHRSKSKHSSELNGEEITEFIYLDMLKGIGRDHSIQYRQSEESHLTRRFVMVEPRHYHLLRKMEAVDDEHWEKKALSIGENESGTHKIFLDAVKTEADTDHGSSLEDAVKLFANGLTTNNGTPQELTKRLFDSYETLCVLTWQQNPSEPK